MKNSISKLLDEYYYDEVEKAFISKIHELASNRPGWWYGFVENVIACPKTTYVKNTTMIINVYAMEVNRVIMLYEVLKQLKLVKAIVKVINKGEFLIVHYYSEKVVEYLVNKYKWTSIFLYERLKELYPASQYSLDEDGPFDLIMIKDKVKYGFFTHASCDIAEDANILPVYLYKDYLRKITSNREVLKMKYCRSESAFIKNIQKCFEIETNL